MESNTERIHRVLLLWLELNRAIARVQSAGHSHPRRRCLPWSNDSIEVREIWGKLTDPSNLLALEQWLSQSADGQSAEWARRALQVCRERIRARR